METFIRYQIPALASLMALTAGALTAEEAPFRPPAVPLVVCDPYFSAWSMNDRLNADWSRHWTGAIHAICGMLRIDGRAWRFASARRVGAFDRSGCAPTGRQRASRSVPGPPR